MFGFPRLEFQSVKARKKVYEVPWSKARMTAWNGLKQLAKMSNERGAAKRHKRCKTKWQREKPRVYSDAEIIVISDMH
ncbi:hypothetical protein CVT25_015807 [Psilocybe cyanescens]|uniref:Uncharacterized protein n=1 Tax=Psilocybe cyanescens TaxID=93625 RepID=A0A409X1E6_PSICY|nr:hypothetical protein CVT25_015807 [Psilocybe cyanescens]